MNERNFRAVMSGFGACVVLGAFLTVVPLCLVRLVGNPLPSSLPAWSSVVATVDTGVLPPDVPIRVVAVVVWIWWSQVALSFVAAVVAACRGRTARSLPLRAFGMQPVVVRLVAIVVTAASTLGLVSQPIFAATPSFAGIAVQVTAGESMSGEAGESPVVSVTGGAMGSSPLAARPPAAALSTSSETPAPPAASAPILAPPTGVPAMPPIASAPAVTSESSPPILAPPEAAATLFGPLDVGSPPAAPSSLFGPPILAPPETAAPSSLFGPLDVGSPPAAPSSLFGPLDVGSPPAAPSSMFGVGAPPPATSPALSPPQHPPHVEVAAAEPAPAALPESGSAAEEIEPSGWVVVKPGDSLWLLAEKHLGDALLWEDIYELNSGPLPGGGTLRDPNLIHPGWRLRLPVPDLPASPDAPERILATPRTPARPPAHGSG